MNARADLQYQLIQKKEGMNVLMNERTGLITVERWNSDVLAMKEEQAIYFTEVLSLHLIEQYAFPSGGGARSSDKASIACSVG